MSAAIQDARRTESARPRRMPQIDGLRGVAVIAVLIQHAIPPLSKIFPVAHAGVGLFFVLSGFLITTILMEDRRATVYGGGGWGPRLRQFYFRRSLRLLPIYLLVVTLGLIFNVGAARSCWAWLLTYTTNFALVFRGEWIDGYFHFWTLAIEEQFYLLWPLIVLAAPRRLLGATVVVMIMAGPLYRALAVARHFSVIGTYCPTPACLDSLGMGALIALTARSERTGSRFFDGPAFWLGLAVIVMVRVAKTAGLEWVDVVFLDLAQAVAFAGLVHSASRRISGSAGAFLEHPGLRAIGTISYGIYVYHVFIPPFTMRLLALATGDSGALPGPGLKVLMLLAIFIVPVLSWFAIERPINRFRDRLHLGSQSPTATKAPGVDSGRRAAWATEA
jgi:peptidoglycan/LPS O-acetylase OafA/YrhL